MGFPSYQSWLLLAALALATLLAIRTTVRIGSWGAVEPTSCRRQELEVLHESTDAENGLPPSARRSGYVVDCVFSSQSLADITMCWYGSADRSIVAIHGLGFDVERAWLHTTTGHCWLSGFLLDDLGQRARIMTYGHNLRWGLYILRKSFEDFAKDLLEALMRVRRLSEV